MISQVKTRTVLVITALSEERRAVLSFLKPETIGTDQDKYNNSYVRGLFGTENSTNAWKVILPAPSLAGNVKSAAKTALSLSINPDLIFLVGVAGGFPGKVNMYDVVVAERVYFTEPAKIDADAGYIARPDQHKVTARLLSRAQSLQDIGGWQRILLPDLPNEKIEVFIEPIAAGEKLVASSASDIFKLIKQTAPRAVAVENEGFGVLEAAHEASVSALVIRGISDLIDNRPTPDADIKGRAGPDPVKIKAARHAAGLMFSILEMLDEEDVSHILEVEAEYVLVKMRWDELKDLAKGRALTLQLTDGAPVKNLSLKEGSVEVEFRTLKIYAALLYATWIEGEILNNIVDIKPDVVSTLIDTSDQEVRSAFLSIKMLNSSYELEHQEGKSLLMQMSEKVVSIKNFVDRVITVVVRNRDFRAHDQSAPREMIEEQERRSSSLRLRVAVSRDVLTQLSELQHQAQIPSRAKLLGKLMPLLIEKYLSTNGSTGVLQQYSTPSKEITGSRRRISLTLQGSSASFIMKESGSLGLAPSTFTRLLLEVGWGKDVYEHLRSEP